MLFIMSVLFTHHCKYNGIWCDCNTSERLGAINTGSIHHFNHLKMPVPSQEYLWQLLSIRLCVLSFDFAIWLGTFWLNFPRRSVFLWFYFLLLTVGVSSLMFLCQWRTYEQFVKLIIYLLLHLFDICLVSFFHHTWLFSFTFFYHVAYIAILYYAMIHKKPYHQWAVVNVCSSPQIDVSPPAILIEFLLNPSTATLFFSLCERISKSRQKLWCIINILSMWKIGVSKDW